MNEFLLSVWRSLVNSVSAVVFCSLFCVALIFSIFGSIFPLPVGAYASQRFLLCAVIAIFIIWGAFEGALSLDTKNISASQLAIVLITALVLGQALLSSPSYAGVESFMYAGFLLAVAVVGRMFARSRAVEAIIPSFVVLVGIAVAGYGAMTLNVYLFFLFEPRATIADFLPWGFVNIRYWSHLATWLLPILPLALNSIRLGKSQLWRFCILLGGGVWVWLILLSSARGTVISLVTSSFVLIFLFREGGASWIKGFAQIWGAGLFIWLMLSVVVPFIWGIEVDGRELVTGGSGRLILWREATAMSMQFFPFGMGPQSWISHSPITGEYATNKAFGHPHNMYLMWASEYGWLCVVILCALLIGSGGKVLHHRDRLRHKNDGQGLSTLCAFAVSVLSGLLHAGVSAVLIAPASMLIGLFLLTLFCGLIQGNDEFSANGTRRNLGMLWGLKVGIVMVVCVWWLFMVSAYHSAMLDDFSSYLATPSSEIFPRFWYHGYFPR